jgi:hypothetical protein
MLHARHRRVAGTTKERSSIQSSCVRRLIVNGFVTTFDNQACRLFVNESISTDSVYQE